MKVGFDPQIFLAQKYGGISRYFCELFNAISCINGISARLIAPLYINAYIRNLNRKGVLGFGFPVVPASKLMKIGLRVLGLLLGDLLLRLYRPQIIHETYYLPVGLGSKKAKRVLTIYDMIHEKFPDQFASSDKTSLYKSIAARRADHIICISESTRRDAIELLKLNPEKFSVVYLGFNALTYAPDKEFNINIGRPFLLYVGHRGGYKNFTQLLKAYSESEILRSQFSLVCFGGSPLDKSEEDLMADLGLDHSQVLWFGGDDSMLTFFYQHAEVFIYPSLYEGFGIPPLEAMSNGCPVVCSNSSSIPEVVADAGEYFDPNDATSMRLSIEKVLFSQDLMASLRRRGYDRIKGFSWDRCAKETLDVYQKLL